MVKLSPSGMRPMIRPKGSFNMRQFSLKLVCISFTISLVLVGCGGGGSTSSGGSVAVCELPLAYANGGSSGNRIDTVAQTINRQFNPCAIQRVQTLTVGVCLDHAQINELSAQLLLPDGTAQNLNIQNANSAGACLISGQLLQTTLSSSSLQYLRSLSGNWSVRVTDNNQTTTTPTGSLVGWSLRAEGLQ